MPKYIIDSNVYIRALREPAARDELKAFVAAHSPFMYIHSVVAAELLAGASAPALEEQVQRVFIAPYEARARIITPSHASWRRAGDIIRRLVLDKRLSANGVKSSFLRDCLIATSSRGHGLTIITENEKDFDLIQAVEPVQYTRPWPSPTA